MPSGLTGVRARGTQFLLFFITPFTILDSLRRKLPVDPLFRFSPPNRPPLPRPFRFGWAAAVVLTLLCGQARSELAPMTEEELSSITGHGFSSFTLTQEGGLDVARMELDIRAATFTEIDSMKLGHYGGGWDENWLGLSMGSTENDLTLGGFYFESQFTDINDASTRQLKRVTIGWTSVTGTISATFNSFTGSIQGTEHQRQDLGPTTIHLHEEGFSMTLDVLEGISFAIGGPP